MTVTLTRKLQVDTAQHNYMESGQPKLRQTKLQKCFTFVTVRKKSAQGDPKIRAKSVLQDFCPEGWQPESKTGWVKVKVKVRVRERVSK